MAEKKPTKSKTEPEADPKDSRDQILTALQNHRDGIQTLPLE